MRGRFAALLGIACGLAACVRSAQPPLAPIELPASLTGSILIEGEADDTAAEAIVFLEPIPRATARPPREGAEMLVRRGEFVPLLRVVQRGQRITWKNLDTIFHGVFSYSSRNEFDLGVIAPNDQRAISLAKVGPVRFHCPIHVGEGGIVFVAPSPHFALAQRDGYAIPGVPAGRYWLSAWTDGWSATRREVTLHAGESAHTDVLLRRERD